MRGALGPGGAEVIPALIAVLSVASTTGFAQSQKAAIWQLQGMVTDNISGAIVPATKITFTNTLTRGPMTTYSNRRGQFRIELKAGTYALAAECIGFKGYRQDGILIKAGVIATLNLVLEVG